LPYLFSALKISFPLAIVGAIVGEFAGATQARLSHHDFLRASRNRTLFAAIARRCAGGDHRVLRHRMTEQRFIFWHSGNME
jgi:NitT/TauT family transport system permease protein